MINRELMTSRKFRSLGWTARALYCAIYPFADRDGRVPGDPEELWASTGAAILIDAAGFSAIVDEIVESGLWIRGESKDGDRFLEIRGFADAQKGARFDREKPGRWNSGVAPDDSGPTPESLRTNSGLSEREWEREPERNGNEKGDPPTLSDIRASFGRAYEAVTSSPAVLSPKDVEAAREAVELGTCDRFPDLVTEFSRTLRGLQSKNLRMSLRATLNNLGSAWGDERPAGRQKRQRLDGDPFGDDPATGRPYHPGA